MYSFFVLGLIPGTNIQITFTMWLEFVLLLAATIYGVHYRHQRRHLPPSLSPEANERITQLARQGQLIRHIAAALLANSGHSHLGLYAPPAHQDEQNI